MFCCPVQEKKGFFSFIQHIHNIYLVMKGSVKLLELLETKANAEARKSLYRESGIFSDITAPVKFVIKLWGSFITRKILLAERATQKDPIPLSHWVCPNWGYLKANCRTQWCSCKGFTFNPKSSLFIPYCGWCCQLVLDDESHVRFKGKFFFNCYVESILLCLELLRTVGKNSIQAHRNQVHF